MNISFDNTENAFAYKTNKQIKMARFLFKTMDNPVLIQLGVRLSPLAIKLGLPVKGLMRKTIFQQFVGGETLEETAAISDILEKYGVQVILDYGVEGRRARNILIVQRRNLLRLSIMLPQKRTYLLLV